MSREVFVLLYIGLQYTYKLSSILPIQSNNQTRNLHTFFSALRVTWVFQNSRHNKLTFMVFLRKP
ncbi:hypothetical protein HanRHA438_Chr06g0276461 [Helianthus annuus]|nr:hypothetical protein HanRHA438_Chr06g0276461 [Helianthus annuus]